VARTTTIARCFGDRKNSTIETWPSAKGTKNVTLDSDDVRAVCDYMNDESMVDNMRFMVEKLAGAEVDSTVLLIDITEENAVFSIEKDGETREVSLAWPFPVTNRADMKSALFGLLDRALLG
jgi:hypothetical protein